MSRSGRGHSAPLNLLSRREVLQRTGIAAGSAVVATNSVSVAARASASAKLERWQAAFQTPVADYQPVALTGDELRTLIAAVDRLIPDDETGPGASASGVHVYIDSSLAGDYEGLLPVYQEGLASLDLAAPSGSFADESDEFQDSILEIFERGEVVTPETSPVATPAEESLPSGFVPGQIEEIPQGFFALLLEHTRQGMFGDPVWGGNRNFAGWDLIKYPGIKLVWTAEEMEIGTVVEPAHISVEEYGGGQ